MPLRGAASSGSLWMTGYFATLLPMWANQIVVVFSR